MLTRLFAALSLLIAAAALGDRASAHPHVWVTIHTELVYVPDGNVAAVKHDWTFDDMFTAFAVQGLAPKTKGVFTRQELASLAEVNIKSLKEFDYFTYAKVGSAKLPFAAPKDYWLSYAGSVLTLHFTLPLKAPVKSKTMVIEVYDPTYFVDFSFAEKDAVNLEGAPAGCHIATVKLDNSSLMKNKQMSEAFFNDPNSSSNWGALFANRMTVQCP